MLHPIFIFWNPRDPMEGETKFAAQLVFVMMWWGEKP
jgi:hypothetical protein